MVFKLTRMFPVGSASAALLIGTSQTLGFRQGNGNQVYCNKSTHNLNSAEPTAATTTASSVENSSNRNNDSEYSQTLSNWSDTHSMSPRVVHEPKCQQDVHALLYSYSTDGDAKGSNQGTNGNDSKQSKRKLRPIGTALSPNGCGFTYPGGDLISLGSYLDDISVDPVRQEVTCGAGARVSRVIAELDRHGLALQNFSSIQEQQIAGWTQVAAHGTGCGLPTVEEQVVSMKLATPFEGIIPLSLHSRPDLFQMAKVGLGSLGVVTELTLACVPKFQLREVTTAFDRSTIAHSHRERLRDNRHVRYMWIPYTSMVISVASNPTTAGNAGEGQCLSAKSSAARPLCELLLDSQESQRNVADGGRRIGEKERMKKAQALTREEVERMSFSQLRDALLEIDPLNISHVKKVNNAEALFWKASTGVREASSTEVLGFDCGGQQLVYEVCFPIGTLSGKGFHQAGHSEDMKDIAFVKRLLDIVEKNEIPAPSPIEQRWSSRSTSPMSPAFSDNADEVFSWVGIIMYLPPVEGEAGSDLYFRSTAMRAEIAARFRSYCALIQPLVDEFMGQAHWAKIELPDDTSKATYDAELFRMRERIRRKFPVDRFNEYRRTLDPENILSNRLIDELFRA